MDPASHSYHQQHLQHMLNAAAAAAAAAAAGGMEQHHPGQLNSYHPQIMNHQMQGPVINGMQVQVIN